MRIHIFKPLKGKSLVQTGLEISFWCKEQGLKLHRDYQWAAMTGKEELHFTFNEDNEKLSTIILLKFRSK